MEQVKFFTDLEQSLKLTDILSHETADMSYTNHCIKGLGYSGRYEPCLTPYCEERELMNKLILSFGGDKYDGIIAWDVVPCWSVSALFEAIPSMVEIIKDGYYFTSLNSCCSDVILESREYNNPVDACYEVILKLHEQKLM